jgi:hypothetical protein
MRILLIAALLVACKGKSEEAAPKKASCHTTVSHACEDYDSNGGPFLRNRQGDCKQMGGTWATSACPTTAIVGSCSETTKNWTRTRHYYAGGSVDLERTKIECGAFGKWLEPAKQ